MGPRRSTVLVFVLAALALWCAAPALALQPAGDGWYWQLPQPQGQLLNAVDMPDSRHAWAVGYGGAILHSGDGGATWASQSSPTAGTLCDVEFVDAERGCVVGGLLPVATWGDAPTSSTALLYTTDGGSTWLPADRPGDSPLAAVTFAGDRTGWAVGGGGTILHTADGGAHWTAQRSGIRRDLWAVLFVDDRRGYAAGDGEVLLETSDAGLTWKKVRPSSQSFFWHGCSALAVDRSGTLWASLGPRNMSGNVPRLASSADGGRHWRAARVDPGYAVWSVIAGDDRILAVGPVDEGDARGTSCALSSTDGGSTWQTQVLGQGVGLSAVADGGSGRLCAVGTGAVWSEDGGQTWRAQGLFTGSAGSLDFVDAQHGWATGSGVLPALLGAGEGRPGSVLHTGDGATWQEQLSETSRSFHDVDFADASHGWVVGSRGAIRHSVDGGESWVRQPSHTRASLSQVEAISATTAWVLGFEPDGDAASVLLRTDDAGATWAPVRLPRRFFPFTMRCLDGREAWVAGLGEKGTQVLKTVDGGATWVASSASGEYPIVLPLSMDFIDASHGWLAGVGMVSGGDEEGVLLATADGGRTWAAVDGADAFEDDYLTAVEFVDVEHGWAAGSGLFATSDGGTTWTRVVGGLSGLSGIAAVDQTHVWAGADGGGIVSTVDASGDTAPPTTLSVGARGWVRRATRIALSASDTGGSGVGATEFRVDGGAWRPYASPIDFDAPADHSGDGVHTVDYRSTDTGALVEPVQSCVVAVDTVRPVIRLRPSKIGRDGVLRLRLRIDDASCPYVDEFEIAMTRRGHSFHGSYDGFRLPTGRWYTFRDSHVGPMGFLPGWYRIRLTARDLAGNRPASVGKSVLLVKRRPAKRAAVTPPLGVRRAAPTAAVWDELPERVRGVLEELAGRIR